MSTQHKCEKKSHAKCVLVSLEQEIVAEVKDDLVHAPGVVAGSNQVHVAAALLLVLPQAKGYRL